MDLTRYRLGLCRLDWSDWEQGPVAGSSEHGNELSDSIKCLETLQWPSDWWLLNSYLRAHYCVNTWPSSLCIEAKQTQFKPFQITSSKSVFVISSHLHVILPNAVLLCFSVQNFVCISHSRMCTIRPIHATFLELMTLLHNIPNCYNIYTHLQETPQRDYEYKHKLVTTYLVSLAKRTDTWQ
jgi:hypothetical protein